MQKQIMSMISIILLFTSTCNQKLQIPKIYIGIHRLSIPLKSSLALNSYIGNRRKESRDSAKLDLSGPT